MTRYVLHTIHSKDERECSIQTCRKWIKHYGVEFMWSNRIYCVDCAKKMLQFDKEDAKRWLVEIEEMEGRLGGWGE